MPQTCALGALRPLVIFFSFASKRQSGQSGAPRLYEGGPFVNPLRQIPDTSGDKSPGECCRVKRLSKVTEVNMRAHGA